MSGKSNQARAVFLQAIKVDSPEKRAEFLDQACHGNPELRERVERLLASHEQLGPFHDTPADAPTVDHPITEKPGARIGPYKLLQQIGEGGMGTVYMAEQKEPLERRVALKIIKPGMDTRQVIARFEAERQALAMMEHPNIAKVLDAGATETGRPYFVMELVKGIPVTQYCDEQHLNPQERLELFIPICQAVQHAHQKGIIHRDLKPSNVLVTLYDGEAVPKVIDFGVAKATIHKLTEKTLFTQLGQVVGTLEYMSPEQAQINQLDVDTRSDLYSLGVMLYELLTGNTPFDRKRLKSAAFDEMLRCEEEPSKPSTKVSSSQSLPSIAANRRIDPTKLCSTIRGELDWIVMKALEKDRARRYETASKFAEDVQHYLNDEPVVASPPSAAYRFRKFARRHRAALSVSSILTLAVLLAVGTVGWVVRDRAAREQQLVREQVARRERIVDQVSIVLDEVDRLIKQQKWSDALLVARRAQPLVATGEVDELTHTRFRQTQNGLRSVSGALAYWRRGLHDEAIAKFNEVLKPTQRQRFIHARYYLGQLFRARGELVDALVQLTAFANERPSFQPVYRELFKVRYLVGDAEAASEDLSTFVKLGLTDASDPADPETFYLRGQTLRQWASSELSEGRARASNLERNYVSEWEKSADRDQLPDTITNILNKSEPRSSEDRQNLRAFLSESDPEFKRLLTQLSAALAIRTKILRLAQNELKKAEDGGLKSADLYFAIGRVKESLGEDLNEVVNVYSRGLEIDPGHVMLLDRRALCFFLLDMKKRAKRDYLQVTHAQPKERNKVLVAQAHSMLGNLLAYANKADEAREQALLSLVSLPDLDRPDRHSFIVLHNVACIYGELSKDQNLAKP